MERRTERQTERHMERHPEHHSLIADIMTTPVLHVGPDVEVDTAYELMVESGCRHLPVVEDGKLLGIISDRDVLLASTLADRQVKPPETTVDQIMTPHPITCSRLGRIADVALVMIDQKIDAVPVLDARGRLVGIVTSTDLMRLLTEPSDSRPADNERISLSRFLAASERLCA